MKLPAPVRVAVVAVAAAVLLSGCVFTAKVNLALPGQTNNGDTHRPPAVSSDGRYVAFVSDASNLVAMDTNNLADALVRDMRSSQVTRVSLKNNGLQITGSAGVLATAISGAGTRVLFTTFAGLDGNDTNGLADVYLREGNTTTRVSVANDGSEIPLGVDPSDVSISPNGHYVAFVTNSALVTLDNNATADVYVRDLSAATTTLVSAGNGHSGSARTPSLSDTKVAFATPAQLVAADTNSGVDVYVRTLPSGALVLASTRSNGTSSAQAGADEPDLANNGRYVVFDDLASDIVQPDNNAKADRFVHDLLTNTTTRVNVSSAGDEANQSGTWPAAISDDGRYVVFDSGATNLVTPDGNGTIADVFVRDRTTNTTTRVDADSNDHQAQSALSTGAAISGDGRYVAFISGAQNLTNDAPDGNTNTFLRTNPVPTVTSRTPASVARGATATITVNGTHFITTGTGAVTGYFGDKIAVTNVNRVSETQVKFTVSVAADAATGPRTADVYNVGTGPGPLATASAELTLTIT